MLETVETAYIDKLWKKLSMEDKDKITNRTEEMSVKLKVDQSELCFSCLTKKHRYLLSRQRKLKKRVTNYYQALTCRVFKIISMLKITTSACPIRRRRRRIIRPYCIGCNTEGSGIRKLNIHYDGFLMYSWNYCSSCLEVTKATIKHYYKKNDNFIVYSKASTFLEQCCFCNQEGKLTLRLASLIDRYTSVIKDTNDMICNDEKCIEYLRLLKC